MKDFLKLQSGRESQTAVTVIRTHEFPKEELYGLLLRFVELDINTDKYC